MVDPPFCLYSSYPRVVISDYASLVRDVNSKSLISVENVEIMTPFGYMEDHR